MKLSVEQVSALLHEETDFDGRLLIRSSTIKQIENFVEWANNRLSDEFRIPNLENATPSFLVDELGDTRAKISQLEKYEGVLKQRLMAEKKAEEERTGALVSWEGEKYGMSVSPGTKITPDLQKLLADYPEIDIEQYNRSTHYVTIRTPKK